jgi:hypothetical protein
MPLQVVFGSEQLRFALQDGLTGVAEREVDVEEPSLAEAVLAQGASVPSLASAVATLPWSMTTTTVVWENERTGLPLIGNWKKGQTGQQVDIIDRTGHGLKLQDDDTETRSTIVKARHQQITEYSVGADSVSSRRGVCVCVCGREGRR